MKTTTSYRVTEAEKLALENKAKALGISKTKLIQIAVENVEKIYDFEEKTTRKVRLNRELQLAA